MAKKPRYEVEDTWVPDWIEGKAETIINEDLEEQQNKLDSTEFFSDPARQNAYKLNPDDPNYVKNTADAINVTGVQTGQRFAEGAEDTKDFGYSTANEIQNLGEQAMDDIAGYGTQQGQKLQKVGQQAAGAITDAAQGGAGELYDFAGDAAAAQAAAAGRTFNPLDFAAANKLYGKAGALGGQLAGLESVEGPSAAQAQLQTGLNAAQQSNLALARSGRGWGGSASALSQAAVQNAMAGQQAANQSAMLRAQENAAWRQRQAANLGTAAGIQTALGQQMQGQTQFAGDLDLRRLGLNDQTALAYAGLGLDASKAAGSMGLEGAIAGGNLAATTFGQGAELGMRGLETGYGMNIGAQQAGGQMGMDAAAQAAALYGAGAEAYLGAIGMENQLWQQVANLSQAEIQDWLTRYGIEQGVAVNQRALDNQMLGAGLSAGGALLGTILAGPAGGAAGGYAGSRVSDPDAKTSIRVLPSSPSFNPLVDGAGSGGRFVAGPGGPVYDRAMASAARADKKYGPREDTMVEVDRQLPIGAGVGAGVESFGSALARTPSGDPYRWNPFAARYLSDEGAKTEIQTLRGQIQSMGGRPPAPMSQAGMAAQQTAAQPAPGAGYTQGNLTPASRQLGAAAAPGQTFTPSAQFTQQTGTPAAAPAGGIAAVAQPGAAGSVGAQGLAGAQQGAAGRGAAFGAAAAMMSPPGGSAPSSGGGIMQSQFAANAIGGPGQSLLGAQRSVGNALAGIAPGTQFGGPPPSSFQSMSAQQAQGIGGSASGATTPSVAKLTGSIGGTPLGQSPTPTPGNALAGLKQGTQFGGPNPQTGTGPALGAIGSATPGAAPGNALAGIPMGSTLGGTPNSGGMFGAQLDAYAKTNAPAPSGGLALSDTRSKMRVAQLEDQVASYGGNPSDSLSHLPLVYDPQDKIYRGYDPGEDPGLGFKRASSDDPWAVPDPLAGPGRMAELDAAQRRQGGPIITPRGAMEMIDKAPGYSYEYKPSVLASGDPGAAPGTHTGPMTRDLKKTPVGRSTVIEDPNGGYDRVDTGRLALANSAALHGFNERLEELETEKGRKRGNGPPVYSTPDLDWLDRAYARGAYAPSPEFGYPGQR